MKQFKVWIMIITFLAMTGCGVKMTGIAGHEVEKSTLEQINKDDLDEYDQKIQDLLYQGKFKEAEPMVSKCLEMAPYNISFLAKKDIVLNGLGRYIEADQVRNEILDLWHKNFKDAWIRKGSPKSEATWARILSFSEDYYVIGTEYYAPEIIGDEAKIVITYKIILAPISEDKQIRLFKLEMSNLIAEYYVLCEYIFNDDQTMHIQRIPYGGERPHLRDVVSDLIVYLNNEEI